MSIDYSKMAFPKQQKQSKKQFKKDISKNTRMKIYDLYKGRCAICGKVGSQIHHILYRSEDKSKIDDVNNLIFLCIECHNLVHKDKKYWQPKLIELRQNLRV